MKALIAIVIIIAAAMGGWKVYTFWLDAQEKEKEKKQAQVAQQLAGSQLPGMVPELEPYLATAQQQGASGLRKFLDQYGKTIADPRLASIELDYIVLVANDNPGEAKKVFAKVSKRVTRDSPLYSRVKQLEKAYQ